LATAAGDCWIVEVIKLRKGCSAQRIERIESIKSIASNLGCQVAWYLLRRQGSVIQGWSVDATDGWMVGWMLEVFQPWECG
jgi:hypothetical protein